MVIFERNLEKNIERLLFKKRAILIFGPRQVGKTTLAKKLLAKHAGSAAADSYFNCDEMVVRNYFKFAHKNIYPKIPCLMSMVRALLKRLNILIYLLI